MRDRIAEKIRSGGAIGFPDFMAMALYDPDGGYYARTVAQVGRGGDFFTSVSVGRLFGTLLARRFAGYWREAGEPEQWRIVECGAHDGSLAADVLAGLAELSPEAFARLEYVVPEPLELLSERQKHRLADFAPRVRWVDSVAACDRLPGVVFGNELLDALPFHTILFRSGRWWERAVGLDQAGDFRWELREIVDSELADAARSLGEAFPDGYETEIRTGLQRFLAPLAACLDGGLMLWLDYGFLREDLYHPSRVTGTLRTFAKHRAGDDPLADPGSRDITAHVDFSALAETVRRLGGTNRPPVTQGAWLTRLAQDWLLAQEGRPDHALLRQFQTLTHPGHLGRSFAVCESTFQPHSGL
ncbi:MAG: SAM-dependent methyltransferase [Verrucomicrobiae bacterium]|nr:SAM-dependent methyltransferase [Verrucomicrobiae bacterium]MCP5545940.1 SAM-dependent methyltransferase [Akkermansiaceae bacterium]